MLLHLWSCYCNAVNRLEHGDGAHPRQQYRITLCCTLYSAFRNKTETIRFYEHTRSPRPFGSALLFWRNRCSGACKHCAHTHRKNDIRFLISGRSPAGVVKRTCRTATAILLYTTHVYTKYIYLPTGLTLFIYRFQCYYNLYFFFLINRVHT